MAPAETVLIVGVGIGLSAALARLCAGAGMTVALAARDTDKLAALLEETGARAYRCDAVDPAQIDALFDAVGADCGVPDLVVYNVRGGRPHGPLGTVDRAAARESLMTIAYGGFLVGQAAARRMAARGSGSIFFTGASANLKGSARSGAFAMAKFALRGRAQSMARELAPQNIHVAHFVIDGVIRWGADDARIGDFAEDGMLLPEALAETMLHVHRQHRSAWCWEITQRPWTETF